MKDIAYQVQLKAMLESLAKLLEEAACGQVEKLKFSVIPILAWRVAHVGSFDEIFSLEVFSGAGEPLLHGHFSRSRKEFVYKKRHPQTEKLISERVMAVLTPIKEGGNCGFRAVDRALEGAGILLPEELVSRLVDSVNGVSHDPHFGAPPPRLVLQQFLLQPETAVSVVGGRITVSLQEKQEPCAGGNYGVIVQLDGSNPEEVRTFAQAKRLYEEGYPFFQPSEAFFREYE